MATRIIGICLVKDEENFVLWALGNVLDFCDEIVVIDNLSSDRTAGLLVRLAAANPKVRLVRDANASGTNAYVQDYIGKDFWVFGIDGDEIYDRVGLGRFRERILAGEFADYWRVLPRMVNATCLDLDVGVATAYANAPSIGKFFNFEILEAWRPDRQRLHGPSELKSGRSRIALDLQQSGEDWDSSDFRCLHLCFFPRSSVDGVVAVRNNITDKFWWHAWRRPLFSFLLRLGMLSKGQRQYLAKRAMPIKNRKYMRGPISEARLSGFGRPADFASLDPGWAAAEAAIASTSAERANQPDLRSELHLRYLGN